MSLLDLPDRPPALEPPPPTAARRFCGACGQLLTTDGQPCAVCGPSPSNHLRGARTSAGAKRVSIRAAAAMYLTLLKLSLTGILVGVTGKLSPGDLDLWLALAQAGIILAFAAVLPRTLLSSRDEHSRPLAQWVALAPFIGLATFSIATVAVVSFNHAFNLPSRDDTSPLLDAGWGWDGVLVMIALMPAVFEEIAFRGVVQQALRPALSVREAIIVQALLFAILHLSAWSIPHLAVMGLTLGFLRARSGSLVPGMVAHFTHNGLCVLAAWMNASSS